MRLIISTLLFFTLSGCAAFFNPVPENYTGPIATILDSGFAENTFKAQFFVLTAIDGNLVDNSIRASRQASYGQGLVLTPKFLSRKIPAKAMKIRLTGTHMTGAPIHGIFSKASGEFFSVEGDIDFTPVEGESYIIKGELKKESSSVWIENTKSNLSVTERIISK